MASSRGTKSNAPRRLERVTSRGKIYDNVKPHCEGFHIFFLALEELGEYTQDLEASSFLSLLQQIVVICRSL